VIDISNSHLSSHILLHSIVSYHT